MYPPLCPDSQCSAVRHSDVLLPHWTVSADGVLSGGLDPELEDKENHDNDFLCTKKADGALTDTSPKIVTAKKIV